MPRTPRLQRVALATIAAATVIPVATAVASTPPTSEPDEETQPTLLPLAADDQRVDLEPPRFSDPTTVDNPLFPISDLHSAVLLGNNEGHPIRIETTLMPYTVTIDVDGQPVEALESQFVAYEDGRIVEVATDWYAQDDDGAVWYLGEDVFNYEDGVVADTEGTWMAGRDGAPAAMIMPADPHGGEVFRPENIAGRADGGGHDQRGRRHDGRPDRTRRGLHHRPGEPHHRGCLRGQVVLPRLRRVLLRRRRQPRRYRRRRAGRRRAGRRARRADDDLRRRRSPSSTPQPPRTGTPCATHAHRRGRDVGRLPVQPRRPAPARRPDGPGARTPSPATDSSPPPTTSNAEGTANAALDVADRRPRPASCSSARPTEIDRERFEVWARQLVVDANRLEAEPGFVAADVTTLEWVLPRFAPTLDEATLRRPRDVSSTELRVGSRRRGRRRGRRPRSGTRGIDRHRPLTPGTRLVRLGRAISSNRLANRRDDRRIAHGAVAHSHDPLPSSGIWPVPKWRSFDS